MSVCECGRTPDPGICHNPGCRLVTGGHCRCMHESTPVDETTAVRQWGSDA